MVVNISVEGDSQEAADKEKEAPKAPQTTQPLRSVGSGFFISSDGYIVTSNHVIDKADRIVVRLLDDKTEYSASVIGKDAKTDIALLKIDFSGTLPSTEFGDSDALEVGEWVMAIGNQFQLGQSVTAGIVSAKARRVPTGNSGPYDAFIQTDASINPGSSGGPLFNGEGQVVGINTAIFSPGRSQFGGSGFNIGIGFAVPSNLAKTVIQQLRDSGKVTRGLLGVLIQRVDSEVAKILKLKGQDGALVSDVMKDSPASSAGFKRRDVIVSFAGRPIRDHDDLPLMVAGTKIGESVAIGVIRDGQQQTISVSIGELKDESRKKSSEDFKPDSIGILADEVTEQTAHALELSNHRGVIVNSVEQGSIAERAGISRGDIILELAAEPVDKLDKYRTLLKRVASEGKPVLMLLKRDLGTRYVVIKFPESKE
jgi:serine protease Do